MKSAENILMEHKLPKSPLYPAFLLLEVGLVVEPHHGVEILLLTYAGHDLVHSGSEEMDERLDSDD